MKRLIYFILNLQLFADAGSLVNATGNYVNAYDGNTTAFAIKGFKNHSFLFWWRF